MSDRKRQKILNVTPITKFEQLPNELILMCFAYLDFYNFYQIFYSLNQRFKQLIQYQTKIQINFNLIPSGKFLTYFFQLNQLITTSQNYSLAIVTDDKYKLNLVLYDDLFRDTISKLKSVTLLHIDSEVIYSIIYDETIKLYQSLERLVILHANSEDMYEDDIDHPEYKRRILPSTSKITPYTPLNLKLIKIWFGRNPNKPDDEKTNRRFLRNLFLNNNSLDTTTIKIFYINDENVLKINL